MLCRSAALISDEYTRYCDSLTLPNIHDVRQQWLEPTQRRNFPNLSIITLNLLSILAMLAELERVFSSIGITVLKQQNRISMVTLEHLECLKSWLKLKELLYLEDLEQFQIIEAIQQYRGNTRIQAYCTVITGLNSTQYIFKIRILWQYLGAKILQYLQA